MLLWDSCSSQRSASAHVCGIFFLFTLKYWQVSIICVGSYSGETYALNMLKFLVSHLINVQYLCPLCNFALNSYSSTEVAWYLMGHWHWVKGRDNTQTGWRMRTNVDELPQTGTKCSFLNKKCEKVKCPQRLLLWQALNPFTPGYLLQLLGHSVHKCH